MTAFPKESDVFPYEYSVVRYRHDPASGESLNIGVILYCREAAVLEARMQSRYARLSAAFPAFDGDQHHRFIHRFEQSIERKSREISESVAPETLPLVDLPANLDIILKAIWQDQELSYQFSPVLSGVSDDPVDALDALYYRYVVSQQESAKRLRREDQDVWAGTFRDALRRQHITEHLVEHTFKIGEFEYRFDFTFKNGKRHALKPVTLDYAEKSGMRDRVDRLLGEAQALSGDSNLGTLYILLGKPSNPDHMAAYRSARKLLEGLDIDHQIVEEEQAETFSRELAQDMRSHGIIQ